MEISLEDDAGAAVSFTYITAAPRQPKTVCRKDGQCEDPGVINPASSMLVDGTETKLKSQSSLHVKDDVCYCR